MGRFFLIFIFFLLFKTEAQTSVLNIADSLFATGNYSKAIEQYKLYKTQKDIYHKIAKSYVAIGNYEQALINYEAYVTAHPTDVLTVYEYAILLSQTKKNKEASKVFKDLISMDNKNPNYHYQLGVVLEIMNDSSAIESYRSTFQLDSAHQKAIYKIGKYFLQNGKSQLAEDYADIGLKTYENNLSLISLKAQIYYLKKNYRHAAIWFKKLLELGESSEFVHKQLSLCYYYLYEYEKAIEHRQFALEHNPNDATTLYVIGSYYYELSDFFNAEKYIKEALELMDRPLDTEYSKLAVVLNSQKKFDEAIMTIKKAINENPANIDTEFLLVLTKDRYYADIDSRIQAYGDFKKRFPSDRYVQYIDSRISELKKEKFIKDGKEDD